MKFKKCYIIFILISFLISQEGTLAKVLFKDGTEKIGWVDINFSDSQVRIESSDGSWASYSKILISDIEYGDFKINKKIKKSNNRFMISLGLADIDIKNEHGIEVRLKEKNAFKYAFYNYKTEQIYNGFVLSGWTDSINNFSRSSDYYVLHYLFGYTHLKFLNENHRGFYYNIDAGMCYFVIVENQGIFGIHPFGLLSVTQNEYYYSSGLEASRSALGLGLDFTIGYSFNKLMLSFLIGKRVIPSYPYDDFNFGYHDISYDYNSIKFSYLF